MVRLNKPTGKQTPVRSLSISDVGNVWAECFYNKDGNWYYAGIYKAFRLENLNTKEWEALSNEVAFLNSLFVLVPN